ncbi:MAG TPA: hypothetical protein VNT42_12980 [Sphingomonas sp.]|nr:hypothetical protein [Sphingomonas sp.]
MASAARAIDGRSLKSGLRHLLCMIALMWAPLVNGQPFFFPDTTSYVRAADLAMYMASSGRISTAWTARYAKGLHHPGKTPAATDHKSKLVGNDVSSGNIMAGRSPYIGALLYLSYVTSNFWLFVFAQAAIAYALIRLVLRRFGLSDETTIVGVVLFLSATTSLPYFNGLLLADALAGFGILSYILLATDRGTLRRWEIIFLALVLLASVTAHMTHILMLLGMFAFLILLRLLRWTNVSRLALWTGIGGVALGFASLMVTSFMIERVFKKPPQLVPLMTARFIEDGPGGDFIRAGCPGSDFAVCHRPVDRMTSAEFLWSKDRNGAGFLAASPEDRARMSAEDTRFALAVWKAYPARQTGMIIYNSLLQMVDFSYEGLNKGCFAEADCWSSLPPNVRDQLRHSVGGRNLWPSRAMNLILYVVVGLSVVVIAAGLPALWRRTPALAKDMTIWLALAFVAMLICDILGGAVSEPQYRYQGRIIWLVPFFAAIIALLDRRASRLLRPASSHGAGTPIT